MKDAVLASLFVVLAWLACAGRAEKRCASAVRAYVSVGEAFQQQNLKEEEIVDDLQRAVGFDVFTCEAFALDDVYGFVKYVVVGFDSPRVAQRVKRALEERSRQNCDAGVWCRTKSITLSNLGDAAWDVVRLEVDDTMRNISDDELFWAAYDATQRLGLHIAEANSTKTADGRLELVQLYVKGSEAARQLEQAINGLPMGASCKAGIFCHALRARLPAIEAPTLPCRVATALALIFTVYGYSLVLEP